MKKNITSACVAIAITMAVLTALADGPAEDANSLGALAKVRVEIARKQVEACENSMMAPPAGPGVKAAQGNRSGSGVDMASDLREYADWSRRWMEGQFDLTEGPANRVAAIRAHIARLEKWLGPMKLIVAEGGSLSRRDVEGFEFQVLEAKSLLLKERGRVPAQR